MGTILTSEKISSRVDLEIAKTSIFPDENSLQPVKLLPILTDEWAIFGQNISTLALHPRSSTLFSNSQLQNYQGGLTLVMACQRRRPSREESTARSTYSAFDHCSSVHN